MILRTPSDISLLKKIAAIGDDLDPLREWITGDAEWLKMKLVDGTENDDMTRGAIKAIYDIVRVTSTAKDILAQKENR